MEDNNMNKTREELIAECQQDIQRYEQWENSILQFFVV